MFFRVLTLLLAATAVITAQPAPVRVPWAQTPEVLSGKWTLVSLKDGSVLEGSWRSVTGTTCHLDVEKASTRAKDKRKLAKGARFIQRDEIEKVHFRKKRIRGRVLGTIAGFYGVTGIASAATGSADALQSGWGFAAIGAGVLGYYAGKSFDTATRELIIEP